MAELRSMIDEILLFWFSFITLIYSSRLTTRAGPPIMTFSTSKSVAIDVSPGVVMARAPWAAP